MQRAGVTVRARCNPHAWIAIAMLHQGAALQDIAAILRRHSIKTMQIYAKVHVDLLQEIPHPPASTPPACGESHPSEAADYNDSSHSPRRLALRLRQSGNGAKNAGVCTRAWHTDDEKRQLEHHAKCNPSRPKANSGVQRSRA